MVPVRPTGIEPVTYCLEGSCSIRLSYGRPWLSGRQDLNLRPSAPKADALPGCATPRSMLISVLHCYRITSNQRTFYDANTYGVEKLK